MKFNALITDISRGVWAINIEAVQSYLPLVQKILAGEASDFVEPKIPNAFVSFLDNNGKPVSNKSAEIPEGSVAVIEMNGPLLKRGDICSYGADEIVMALQMADANSNIIGTVLKIDGPGGSVAAIPPFIEFGKKKTKPVVALYDTCCSAHLYAMLSCADHIMADNNLSSTIGSIGVMLSLKDNREELKLKGITLHEIYPDESANKNEAFRLALDGKYDMIKQEMLSPLAVKFQEAVKLARPNLKSGEPGLLTGKTFTADKAKELGLIDSIGCHSDAVAMVQMLGEMNRYK